MPIKVIRKFMRLEAASGILLFLMALLALILDNSPWGLFYEHVLQIHFKVTLGHLSLNEPLSFWIDEGLMTIFFLLVGLELKREFLEGELSGISKIILPSVGAIGGMLVPALLFVLINLQTATLRGWAIPVATDIAFAIGVLSLFNSRVPIGLKLFLMTLAIFDDMGAIVIITFFFSHSLSILYLMAAGMTLVGLWALNSLLGVRHLFPYLFLGFILWLCVLQSGIHASIAGVLLSVLIPLKRMPHEKQAPLHRLEEALHPWVAYLVMPLFAFANAGVSFAGLSWQALFNPLTLGIAVGLFIGKQSGVFAFVWVMVKCNFAKLPARSTWLEMYGVSLLCGIGFTMSLFLGALAFQGSNHIYGAEVRIGVLLGSILSGVMGALVLRMALPKKRTAGFLLEAK